MIIDADLIKIIAVGVQRTADFILLCLSFPFPESFWIYFGNVRTKLNSLKKLNNPATGDTTCKKERENAFQEFKNQG